MTIRNPFKLSALAAIVTSQIAVAGEQGMKSSTYEPPQERRVIESGTVQEGATLGEDGSEARLSETISGSRSSEENSEIDSESRDDYLGILSFEGKSTELSETSKATIANISEEVDKSKPVELTVEVADAVQTVDSEVIIGDGNESELEQGDELSSDAGNPGINNEELDQSELYSATAEKTNDRAEKIKAYFADQGVKIEDMVIESTAKAQDELTVSQRSDESLAIATGQRKMGNKSSGRQAQKLRIVITEV